MDCQHRKVYQYGRLLLTDPPQQRWICSLCLEEGAEQHDVSSEPSSREYEDIVARKRKLLDAALGRTAFTLLELLVCIAIVAVLASMLVIAVQKVREAANRVSCVNNLHSLGIACHLYREAYGGFPDKDAYRQLGSYLEDTDYRTFRCPSKRSLAGASDYQFANPVYAVGYYSGDNAILFWHISRGWCVDVASGAEVQTDDTDAGVWYVRFGRRSQQPHGVRCPVLYADGRVE